MRIGVLLIAGVALAGLAGCNRGGDGEIGKGQVVATVDGKDVTIHELNAELAGANLPDGAARKQVEQAALQQVVNRRILADIAREQKLDKTPAFVLQQHRGEEALLVQMLQRKVASGVRNPGREDVQNYITAHPELFANHKLYVLDQITFQPPKDVNRLRELQPLKTMEEVEAKLTELGSRYRRLPTTLDPLQTNPQVIAAIQRIPAGEIFLVPVQGGVTANRLMETRSDPITGDMATQIATRAIQQQRFTELAAKQLDAEVKKRREDVKYQPGFAPPAPKPAAKPAAAK